MRELFKIWHFHDATGVFQNAATFSRLLWGQAPHDVEQFTKTFIMSSSIVD